MITAGTALLILLGATAASAGLILVLMPTLARYALARPNARSSHKTPTPQGGGFAVVAVTIAATLLALAMGVAPAAITTVAILGAMAVLCVLGGIDDVRPLPVVPRLAVQVTCALALVLATGDGRIIPLGPLWLETAILTLALAWFINLTNFMDGIDGITVAEAVPLAAILAALGLTGSVAALIPSTPLAIALAGAMLGFAPFNRHVAKLFLGDSGSLAIGAALGTLLIVLAKSGHLTAAVILALYYAADATLTLARRWRRGERLLQAHRTHFYQLATQRGFTVPQVTDRVWALNGGLAALAVLSLFLTSLAGHLVLLALAAASVGYVLWRFESGRPTITAPSKSARPRTARAPRARR